VKIGIVGLGIVGLSTGVVLAEQGHKIIGIDIDENKVKGLNCKRSPIYDPGLQDMINRNFNNLIFTTDYSLLSNVDVVFITVSTPTVNGKIYLEYVFDAAKKMKEYLSDSIVVIKSTVVPGTARKVKDIVGKEVVVNPEFLREGNAILDTKSPDRIVIGSNGKGGDVIEDLWSFTGSPILRTSLEEAEMIKYAANSFLAVKISFINEIANLCERIGCDVNVIAKAIGLDKRISPYFLNAGIGWGGSCFPKDTLAITSFARDIGERLRIIEAAIEVNNERPIRVVNILEELMGSIRGKNVCILGIAFKPDTDDTRESVALKIIDTLKSRGANVLAYDPKAVTDKAKIVNIEECIRKADGVIIATEWKEFIGIESLLQNKYVVDGRRILNPSKMDKRYFRAIGLGD
jgi:UDPglucose 6-dehydrogenase